MDNVVAIVQARMGSTRLPGKVLKPILGRPMLGYLIDRVRQSKLISEIILATSTKSEDTAIVEFCESENVKIFRGSENDVLDRYYQAAQLTESNYIMRLTGDNPLIDPQLCDRVIETMFEIRSDIITLDSTFAEGLDCCLVSRSILEEAWNEASLASEREHVTLFIHNHPERYRIKKLTNSNDDSAIRITVDEAVDFSVVSQIIEKFYPSKSIPTFDQIRQYLLSNPSLVAANSSVPRNEGLQKSLEEDVELDPRQSPKNLSV